MELNTSSSDLHLKALWFPSINQTLKTTSKELRLSPAHRFFCSNIVSSFVVWISSNCLLSRARITNCLKRNSNLFPYELLALNQVKKGLDHFNNNTAAWEVRGAGEALQRSILTRIWRKSAPGRLIRVTMKCQREKKKRYTNTWEKRLSKPLLESRYAHTCTSLSFSICNKKCLSAGSCLNI